MSSHRRQRRDEVPGLFLAAVAALLLAGCGGGEARTTVEGKITYQDKPVTAGLINFQPAAGKTFGGSINSDGTYSFEMPPGEYQVRIDAVEALPPWKEGDPPPPAPKRLAPAKYAGYATSELKATIGEDSPQEVNFPLK